VTRLVGWLGIVALAVAGHYLDSPLLRSACIPAILLLIAVSAPAAMRIMLIALATVFTLLIALGDGDAAFDATPALIAAVVGWMFARTLMHGRRPLIARAIAAIDGAAQLDDPAVARYARQLTLIWALYQALLAGVALLLALHAWWWPQVWPGLPGPRLFGVVVLPLAVTALALGEFAVRPLLLPQAPRKSLLRFICDLVRAWPALLNE
jgi:uncharacterized membrane protein